MRGFSNPKRRHALSTRGAVAIVAGVLLLTAVFVPASLAAAPVPSDGSVTVDGATGDWSLGADLFSDMNDGVDGHPVRAKFYARYDCDAEALYGLVLVQGDEKARQDRPDEAYITIDGSGKLTDPSDGNNGTPPDFAWVNGDGTLADGWEASGPLAPGSYSIRAHVLVADDSADGYTPMDLIGRNAPLEIDCGGEVAPTQGTRTPTPKPPTGGVGPTTGTRPSKTLPPTDTLDPAGMSGPGGAGLVLLFLGLGSFASLVVTRRRRPVTIEVKETVDRP
jgi:hypothetical protein